MDAEEVRLVIAAREQDKDRERRLFAGLVAEVRNLALVWSSERQRPWTVAQVLGEEPRQGPMTAAVNSMAALDAAIAAADREREERAREEAEGWFESLDGPSLHVDDDDPEVTP